MFLFSLFEAQQNICIQKTPESCARLKKMHFYAIPGQNFFYAIPGAPEIEKLWYQKYGFEEPLCPTKLIKIISSLRNDNNDDISIKFEYIEYGQDDPNDISVISDSNTEYADISNDISIKFEYIKYGQDNPNDISMISDYDTECDDISVISDSDTKWDDEYNDNQYDFDKSSEYNEDNDNNNVNEDKDNNNDNDNNKDKWIKAKFNNNNDDHVGSNKYDHNTKCNSDIANRYGVLWSKDDDDSVNPDSDTEYDDKYNDDIHSSKDNNSDKIANITGVSVKNIEHESEENIKHNRTNNNTTTTTQSTKPKTKIDCDITGVHSNKTIEVDNTPCTKKNENNHARENENNHANVDNTPRTEENENNHAEENENNHA